MSVCWSLLNLLKKQYCYVHFYVCRYTYAPKAKGISKIIKRKAFNFPYNTFNLIFLFINIIMKNHHYAHRHHHERHHRHR